MAADTPTLERRALLGVLIGAGVLARSGTAVAALNPGAPSAAAGGAPAPTVDAAQLLTYIKMNASITDALVPWYYTGRIYASRGETAPVHLCDLEGTEIYSVTRTGVSDWTMGSSTLTFFRDRSSGQYIDRFDNPFTGQTLEVRPNRLKSDIHRPIRLSVRGMSHAESDIAPWEFDLHANGPMTWLTTSRAAANPPQPWIEVQTMFAPTAQLADPSIVSASTTFVSTYLAPWLRWMNMADVPGHLVWHSAGRKLASLDELPADYRKRAEGISLEHFQRR